MFLVLVTHASYLSLNPPSQVEISTSFDSALLRSLSESFSIICVNSFVLISGWYGIRVKIERSLELLFQVLFISIVLYFILRVIGLTEVMNMNEWLKVLLFKHNGYWFVRAYIILYLFAPVLNSFALNVDKGQFKLFLIAFYIIQTVYGFYHYGGWYAGGYSPLSFLGLYLLARYMHIYSYKYMRFNKYIDLSIYSIVSIIIALCSLAFTYYLNKGATLLFLYSSPFVILSSIYFFLFFSKLSFRSERVNWVAASCFAVYLVHNSPFVFRPYYIDVIKQWYETESRFLFLQYTSGLIIVYFIFSVLFDKVRIFVWQFLYRNVLNVLHKH